MTCQIYGQTGIICVFLFLLAIKIAWLFHSVLKSCFKSGLLPILIWSLKSCFSQQKYHSLSLLMTKSVLSPKRRNRDFIRSLPYSLSVCEPIRGRLSSNSGFAHFLSFQEKSSMVSRSLPIAVSTFQVDEIILKKSRSDSLFCQISYILQFGHHYDRLFWSVWSVAWGPGQLTAIESETCLPSVFCRWFMQSG